MILARYRALPRPLIRRDALVDSLVILVSGVGATRECVMRELEESKNPTCEIALILGLDLEIPDVSIAHNA